MNTMTRLITVTLISIAVTGCGYLKKKGNVQDRDTHYLTARSVPALKMPPGISSDAFHTTYPVSEGTSAIKPVSIVPPGLKE